MAKKKSKTQKYKKNLKRKMNKAAGKVTTKQSNVIKVDKQKKEQIKKVLDDEYIKEKKELAKEHKTVVPKDKINYNVLLKYASEEHQNKAKEELLKTKEILKQEIKEEIKEDTKKFINEEPKKEEIDDITTPFIGIIKEKQEKKKKSYFEIVSTRIKQNIIEAKKKRQERKNASLTLPKLKNEPVKKAPKTVNQVNKDNYYNPYEITEPKPKKEKNILIRAIILIYRNLHIIFNSVGILIFILMIVGLVRIKVYETNTIIYISCIVGFLLFVAVSFNKYLSGKVLTIILSIGMIYAINYMQYTYDFLRNLNSSLYEYKTYYIVTFDNGVNKSIYNINNKKVGLLKENSTNIERKLNTKIKPVYIEYDDINELYNDFYSQNFRAILVNENEYKYLKNNIQNNRSVKILYEFEANCKK